MVCLVLEIERKINIRHKNATKLHRIKRDMLRKEPHFRKFLFYFSFDEPIQTTSLFLGVIFSH